MTLWVVFLLCGAVVVYVYFGYPCLLALLARFRPASVERGAATPSVSCLIPVFNEEQVIADKLRNTLELDYPADRLQVVIVSDGSTDATVDIVNELGDERVLLEVQRRQGKAAALNRGAAVATGDILVLTDANALLEAESLRFLLEPFADPTVGGVCGHKRLRSTSGDSTGQGEGLYWRYDTWQKELESRIGSVFAADGTLYALRRDLYTPIDDPAQADDIAISARVVLQGYRLLYERRAVAWEKPPADGREELRRKIRVTNHSVLALLKLGRALWLSGFYSFELLSHKLLRHFVPFFLVPLLVSHIALAAHSLWLALLLVPHSLVYLLGLTGALSRDRALGRWRLLSVPYYFCLVNLAALLGVVSILWGRRTTTWTPRGGLDPQGDT